VVEEDKTKKHREEKDCDRYNDIDGSDSSAAAAASEYNNAEGSDH